MAPIRASFHAASVISACRSARASIALGLLLGAALTLQPSPARSAEFVPKPDFVPKADTYICPNAAGGAIECYLDAVPHLYTMCRQVKSIEIIEHGYEKSTEGTNGAKSEYCIDKHRLSMARPYQAALKEATPNAAAVDALRALQELWLRSLSELKWNPGETDEQYKARVARPYEAFSERVTAVRAVLVASKDKAPPPSADKGKKGKPATPPPKTKSAT
jgi:hypothetical protein